MCVRLCVCARDFGNAWYLTEACMREPLWENHYERTMMREPLWEKPLWENHYERTIMREPLWENYCASCGDTLPFQYTTAMLLPVLLPYDVAASGNIVRRMSSTHIIHVCIVLGKVYMLMIALLQDAVATSGRYCIASFAIYGPLQAIRG
jgi:hypothetical protein